MPDFSKLNTALDSLSTTLSSSSLAPQKDVVLPDPKPNTANAGLQGTLEGVPDAFTASLEADKKAQEKNTVNTLEDYISALGNAQGYSGFLNEEEQKAGVDQFKTELNDINDQIRREQRALDLTIREIEKNPEGKFGGAVQQDIEKARSESLQRQADLAIVQLAAQGKYDSAKAIADRAATARFEQEENKLEARKFFYQENKDLFDKADQRLFETQLSDRERVLANERKDFETLQSVKLQALQMAQTNNAPTSVLSAIQNAKTPEEVLDVGGQYAATDLLARQQLQASIANAALTNRMKRLELAKAGDTAYMAEFGIDPDALTEEEIQARLDNQGNALILQDGQQRLQQVIDNNLGLELSSGQLQSATLSGFFGGQGGKQDFVSTLPVVGNFVNYTRAKQAKEQFAADVQYLLSNRVFEKVAEIKKAGYAGAISDTELTLMANASSVLNALSIKDDAGNITGFRGGEGNLRTELNTYMDIYQRAADALNTQYLTNLQKSDIMRAYNE